MSRRLPRISIGPALFAAAAISLGHALQINNGFYDPRALTWITAALALSAAGMAALAVERAVMTLATTAVLGAGLAWQIAALFTAPPGLYLADPHHLGAFHTGLAIEAVAMAAGITGWRKAERVWFPVVLVVTALLGLWVMHASPDPPIDVVTVHREAIKALVTHHDPYRVTFENIYENASLYYNPSLVVGNRVAFGYPYPPLSLLLAAPGQILFGDYRYAELAACLIATALIGYVSPRKQAPLAACLLLTTPRIFFVLEQGWTEPISLLTLAALVVVLVKRPALAGVVGGLYLVTKQYLLLGAPALLKAAYGKRRGPLGVVAHAAFAGAAVTLPLALWHPHAFFRAVIWLQTVEPFRADSLSYLTWAARAGYGEGTFKWAVAAGTATMLACVWAMPATATGLAASIGFSTLALFAFGSKAFCNYYFFVVGALCCGIAAASAESAERNGPA